MRIVETTPDQREGCSIPVSGLPNGRRDAFPSDGDPDRLCAIQPGALVPVEIDADADAGLDVEPRVWMRHA